MKTGEGRQVLYELAAKADVIVQQGRPGAAKGLGVDYDTIRKINPRIIYCGISAYGEDGPYRDLTGTDINNIAVGGLLGLIGERDGPPVIPISIGNMITGGIYGAVAILAALIAREKIGKGQFIDVSMTDGVVSLLPQWISRYFWTGEVPKRGEMRISGAMPYYNVYETKDGRYISIGCEFPQLWVNLCKALGREEFAPYFDAKGEKQEEILSSLRDTFRTKTRDEWFQFLRQFDVGIAPVYELDEVLSDPHVLHRNMVVEVDHPTEGKVKQVGIPLKFSETPGEIRRLTPALGEHTDEVMLDLGYTRETIEDLRERGIVK